MSVISNIVLDELKRNINLQKSYLERLSSYEKGSLVCKKRNNNEYYYLSYRNEQGIPKYKYIGSKDSKSYVECVKSIENYKYFIQQLKHLKSEEKDMRKMLNSVKEYVNV